MNLVANTAEEQKIRELEAEIELLRKQLGTDGTAAVDRVRTLRRQRSVAIRRLYEALDLLRACEEALRQMH